MKALTKVGTRRGFTLIEVGLALMAFLLILSLTMIFINQQRSYRRDVTRTANMNQLSKALALYAADKQAYPNAKTCISGSDSVIQALINNKNFDVGVQIADPRWPNDPDYCYLYEGNGSAYKVRYFLETDKAGPEGYNYIRP